MQWSVGPRHQGFKKTSRARVLRFRGTDAERRFCSLVRDRRFLGLKFRRQVAFGLEIKRYSDSEVLREPENVLEDLELFIAALNPHPVPLLFKEREH